MKNIATPNFTLAIGLSVVKYLLYRYSEQGGIMVNTPLGRKIRELRKEKGYTLEKLAELADSSKSYIWELENKNPPRPSAEKVAKIANVLGVTADYLMEKSHRAPDDDVLDAAFFREFQNLDGKTKERLRDLVKLWGNKG
jgi:transcriptional regulator with XRE-family HTH domain